MKKLIILIPFLGFVYHCIAQVSLDQPTIKFNNPKAFFKEELSTTKTNQPKTEFISPEAFFEKELLPTKPQESVFPDGVALNEKKYFMQIKQPDLSKVNPMPQASIDTTTHYHIQIIGAVEEKK